MASAVPGFDFTGARGSNTGDEFHELWAVRASLKLIQSDELQAVAVEGIPSPKDDRSRWDGVDCALLFGSDNECTADRVEIQQLKYSSASPNKSWTVSRICSGSDGKAAKSVMRRLGVAFKGLISKRKARADGTIKVVLITNQPISKDLETARKSALGGVPGKYRKPWKSGDPLVHRLVHASGLSPAEFKRFAACLEFRGGTDSRFFIEEQMLYDIAQWADTEFTEIASRMRKFVRNRMLPETTNELITKQSVLVQFGVADMRALFPCPNKIESSTSYVNRNVVPDFIGKLKTSKQHFYLHGVGGVGKTTVLQQLGDELPTGSELIVYDCYGAGSYLDASELRHRARDAFLQLSNELASRLRLPMLMEPKADRDFVRAFRRRLDLAARSITLENPDAMIVLVIDAADNAITAANERFPKEASFIADFASMQTLPNNVKLIVSARSGRSTQLNLPSQFEQVELGPFDQSETNEFVKRLWMAPEDWLVDFHHLSNGIPRVQDYALQNAAPNFKDALEYLRPNGKNLAQLFVGLFQEAIIKSGSRTSLTKVCAGITALPHPTPVPLLAEIIGIAPEEIRDICTDLSPGVQIRNEAIVFSDEDFEDFVRQQAQSEFEKVALDAAKHLLTILDTDEYAATHAASMLIQANLGAELLELVEKQPWPPSTLISDPVRRYEVYAQRLLAALQTCRTGGDAHRALKFLLIGAEGRESEEATTNLLLNFPRLSARYARETSGRVIMENPGLQEHHGPYLFHQLSVEAENGDAVGVRETRRRLSGWFEARRDDYRERVKEQKYATRWEFSASDVASALVSQATIDGVEPAIKLFRRVMLKSFALKAGQLAVDRLLAAQNFSLVAEIANQLPTWTATYPLLRLASVGIEVDLDRLAVGLSMLQNRWPLENLKNLEENESGLGGATYADLLITGAELLASCSSKNDLTLKLLYIFTSDEARKKENLFTHDTVQIDAIIRAYMLANKIQGHAIDKDSIFHSQASQDNLSRKSEGDGKPIKSEAKRNELDDLITSIAPFYERRAEIIINGYDGATSKKDAKRDGRPNILDPWRIQPRYEFTRYRSQMAKSLLLLPAKGVPERKVLEWAYELIEHFRFGGVASDLELIDKLAPFSSLHDPIVEIVTADAEKTRTARAGAQERSLALANFAESLVLISPEDADALFQQAVEVASQLDSEIIQQLEVSNSLVQDGFESLADEAKSIASIASEVVADAAVRLEHYDGFPWKAAIKMIARLDFPTAAACVARWHDEDIASFNVMLEALIRSGLDFDTIDCAQASALALLVENPHRETLQGLIEAGKRERNSSLAQIATEIARDTIADRVAHYSVLDEVVAQYSQGSRSKKFENFVAFQSDMTGEQIAPEPQNEETVHSGFSKLVWQQDDLLDSDRLQKAATKALEDHRQAGNYGSLLDVLCSARQHVAIKDRPAHLNALSGLVVRNNDAWLIEAVTEAASAWSDLPSVKRWSKREFPIMLREHLSHFVGRMYWGSKRLDIAISLSGLNGKELQLVILEGVERSSKALSARDMLEIALIVSKDLSRPNVAELAVWYLKRLFDRISEDDLENVIKDKLPVDATKAVGTFLVAYMSDVDLSLRWRAAHALRRLARFEDAATIRAVLDNYPASELHGFRAQNAPYYWAAVRLWMALAFCRVSEEKPSVAALFFEEWLAIATDSAFPHLLVRDHAAKICERLIENGVYQASEAQLETLASVNKAEISSATDNPVRDSYGPWYRRDVERFHFNAMDTLPYWYQPWLNVFCDLTAATFLEIAEGIICDDWGISDEEPYGSKEPRPQRFQNQRYSLASHSHGSLPKMEHHRTHLEWHAMWCTAGKLLSSHSLLSPKYDDWDTYQEKLNYGSPTHPPYWLSDFVGSPPLIKKHWECVFDDVDNWKESVTDDEFLETVLSPDLPEWVVVDSSISTMSGNWEERLSVSSALVAPGKAHALVRAFQTADSDYDFYLPSEGGQSQIDADGFCLRGWLAQQDGDILFDEKDPFNNGIHKLYRVPGQAVSDLLGLEPYLDSGLKWRQRGETEPAFVYEAWGSEREDDNGREVYLGQSVVSAGHRLLVRRDLLAAFLEDGEEELIVEVGVTKRDKRGKRATFLEEDPRETVYNRVLLLKRDGSIQGAERCFKPWHEDRTRAQAP